MVTATLIQRARILGAATGAASGMNKATAFSSISGAAPLDTIRSAIPGEYHRVINSKKSTALTLGAATGSDNGQDLITASAPNPLMDTDATIIRRGPVDSYGGLLAREHSGGLGGVLPDRIPSLVAAGNQDLSPYLNEQNAAGNVYQHVPSE